MDYFSHQSASVSDVFSGKNIKPDVRAHLSKVYGAMCYCFLLAAAGAAIGGNPLFSLLGFVCLIYILCTRGDEKLNLGRLFALTGFGLFEGMGISPLVHMAAQVDPSLIITALFGTAGIFVCFTLAALMAPKRSYLALGGYLSGTLFLIVFLGFMNLFFRSEVVNNFNLGVGLLVMMGYILYDTQMVLEKAEQGDRDYVFHGVNLFIDFLQIFIRLLIILLKNSKKEEKK